MSEIIQKVYDIICLKTKSLETKESLDIKKYFNSFESEVFSNRDIEGSSDSYTTYTNPFLFEINNVNYCIAVGKGYNQGGRSGLGDSFNFTDLICMEFILKDRIYYEMLCRNKNNYMLNQSILFSNDENNIFVKHFNCFFETEKISNDFGFDYKINKMPEEEIADKIIGSLEAKQPLRERMKEIVINKNKNEIDLKLQILLSDFCCLYGEYNFDYFKEAIMI